MDPDRHRGTAGRTRLHGPAIHLPHPRDLPVEGRTNHLRLIRTAVSRIWGAGIYARQEAEIGNDRKRRGEAGSSLSTGRNRSTSRIFRPIGGMRKLAGAVKSAKR